MDEKLRMNMKEKEQDIEEQDIYDVIIIGGGPAGLTAAIYLGRARYRVLVLEKEQFGGQITITSEVVNYPGVAQTDGKTLTTHMRHQAEAFGAECILAEAKALDLTDDIKTVRTDVGDYRCFGVLLATGAHPRMAGFAGEAAYRGRGVAYCATCDGEFFTGMDVFVVGGGYAAAEESVFLTRYARHVTILVREDDFTCARAVAENARSHPKITVLTNTEVVEAAGDQLLRTLRYRCSRTGKETLYRAPKGQTFGLFVFAGYAPATELVKDSVRLDAHGYVVTDCTGKTSAEGLYAAGDVRIKNLRQVVTAVGDGAAAATELERYASALQKRTGIHPRQKRHNASGSGDISAGEKRPDNVSDSKPDNVSDSEPHGISSPEPHGISSPEPHGAGVPEAPISDEMRAQLAPVFERMTGKLQLQLYLDDGPISAELRSYMEALAALTDKLSVRMIRDATDKADERKRAGKPNGTGKPDGTDEPELLPCVRICREDGSYLGLAFHGVPGGHEFSSFVLGLYNAAGPGQTVEQALIQRIDAIRQPIQLQIIVSLSCTMCPELVTAAQHIAALQPLVTAEVYDLNHYPQLREQYHIMSVPCMVMNGEKVTFGKKNMRQVLDFITS